VLKFPETLSVERISKPVKKKGLIMSEKKNFNPKLLREMEKQQE
jgi:hypothetical protein